MAFMQYQITDKQDWLRVETTQGTEFVDAPSLSLHVRASEQVTQPLTDVERETYVKQIWQYTEGMPESWGYICGYGARLSAPGYLDCTEWAVFDTEREAQEYLNENYPEDDEN